MANLTTDVPDHMTAVTSAPDWKPGTVGLKFMLGEFFITKVSTMAFVDSRHFALRDTKLVDDAQVASLLKEAPLVACISQPVTAELPRLSRLPAAIRYIPFRYQRFYVELNGSFENYLQKFSGKSRKNLLREVKKIESVANGAKYFYEYRTPEEIDEFHTMARSVSKLTYQERLLEAGLPDTPEYRADLVRSAAAGGVRGYLLIIENRPIAYVLCSVHGSRVSLEEVGYDPTYKGLSPGTVLRLKILESFFNEPALNQFDFGAGEADYKEFFSTASTSCADVYFFRRTLRNNALVVSHYGLDRFSRGIVALLDRWHVKESVKKAIRRWKTRAE